MTHYLFFLGEFAICDGVSYHCKWSDLYKGSYNECKEEFRKTMVEIFSQYGEGYGDVQLSEIECQKLPYHELKTDGIYLHLNPI